MDSRRCKCVARQTGGVNVAAVAVAIAIAIVVVVIVVVAVVVAMVVAVVVVVASHRWEPSPKRARTPASLVASRESTALRVRGYRNEEPAGRRTS